MFVFARMYLSLVIIANSLKLRAIKIHHKLFTFSSTYLAQNRAIAFSKGSSGNIGFSVHVSSMYSRMMRDSAIGFSPCTSTGIFLWTGLY